MSYDPGHQQAEVDEAARRRNEEIRASGQPAKHAVENDQDPSPGAESPQVPYPGCRHDYGEAAAHQPAHRDPRAPRR